METYRIIPLGRTYRVEAVQLDGQTRVVVRMWLTEDGAIEPEQAKRWVSGGF